MEQTLGKRIVHHRKRLGLTQDQLAEQLGVTAQAVSKWENDQSCPDITMLPRLAEIFGTSTDALLGHETQQVHEAEIVEEDPKEPGLRIEKDGMEFHYNGGRKSALGFALLVLLVGGLLLASGILGLGAGFWEILWPSALLVWGLFGVFPRFSFFRFGCALAGGYFLINNLNLVTLQLDGSVVFAGVLLLFGLSLLVDALRKPKKPRFRVVHRGGKKAGTTSRGLELGQDSFAFSASFGELREQVELDRLAWGEISTSFGDYTVDLSGVQSVAEQCSVEASCSFGELTILVPRCFKVKEAASAAFGEVSTEGHPDPDAKGTILLEANCSFGEITIRYI